MDLLYGLGLLLVGTLATVTFFWIWFKIQEPEKKPDPEDNEVLRRSGFLDDDNKG